MSDLSLVRRWLLAASIAGVCRCCQAAPVVSEAQVKAAFLFHFTQFVNWPAPVGEDAQEPFQIGVIGDDSAFQVLTEMVQGESLGKRPLKVVRVNRSSDADSCQIIYVSSRGETLFRRLRLENRPVLTVGETDSFIRAGGMIEFLDGDNHVTLKINLTAARAASLEISAKLLRVAQVFPSP